MNGFADRAEAGQALAWDVARREYENPVVLALPRGGVPIGIALVRELKAPMDLIMVRKIGVPRQPELAAAAVVNGDEPRIVRNEDVIRATGLGADDIERLASRQLEEIQRRRKIYLDDRATVPVQGRTAIVVDDGIATGATMRAALLAVRQRQPARLVLAVPVAPADTIAALRHEVDEVICLLEPEPFIAIGAHYRDFSQTSDDEVVRLMAEADRLSRPQEPQ